MTLSSGSRLGPYEILGAIGAGGMGEVYRARDTRLERTVAIKVLPSHLSASPELRQRFEREAKTISALSHPHICALYDVGHQDGTDYLVMEYLEGETLTDRLVKGPLPTEQLLRHGIEIADALDKAHRQGIVHRDLKPGNVMLTKSGVKLVDFGLAKFSASTPSSSGLSVLPTQAGQLTQEGTILGTFQYMAPEQLEGKEADARTDIFAFGSVLYEMATGQKAFSGKSQASLIASIISSEPPPISTVQPMTPPALDRVVKTCLAKDPEDRWQTAHDVMLQLKWIAEGGSGAGLPAPVVARRKTRERLAWAVAAVALLVALGAATAAFRYARRAAMVSRPVRSSILPPENSSFSPFPLNSHAISPDGTRIAFAARAPDGKNLLWVRSLNALSGQPLAGTENAFHPFWSPDSRFLGFFAQSKLKRVEAAGGPVQLICDAQDGRGGTWNRDGNILFSPTPFSPIYRVSASGGVLTPITKLDETRHETTHRWPVFLPDGRHFFFFAGSAGAGGQTEGNGIYVGSLDSKSQKLLVNASSNAAYVSPGYLLFAREQNLMAQPFDAESQKTAGEAFPTGEQVAYSGRRQLADFAVSDNGVLSYRTSALLPSQLVWFDRTGRQAGAVADPDYYGTLGLSPDGRRIAVFRFDPKTEDGDIWLYELSRNSATRFTFEPAFYASPVWSPDGGRLVFAAGLKGGFDIYEKATNGESAANLIIKSNSNKAPSDWSSDGRFIAYGIQDQKNANDLWILPFFADRKPFPFLKTPFNELDGHFSPDVRWMAYQSNESGKNEVYVRPIAGTGGKWKISSGGGIQPRWRRDGKELFYLSPEGKVMAAEVRAGSAFDAGIPRSLFDLPSGSAEFERLDYDVSADGQRFLVNAPAGKKAPSSITLVQNWTAGLKR